ncbi:hypothetical protein HED60_08130 [Planctomycetales bacterium ZRK34]|nr:hypothetical protein HED60_08130 [Planctomycetales bacterium ZRK34]
MQRFITIAICLLTVNTTFAQSADELAAVVRDTLAAPYGGRMLQFADHIDEESRKAYLARYGPAAREFVRKIGELPDAEKVAAFVAGYQDQVMKVTDVKVKGDQAQAKMAFDYERLADWIMAVQVNNEYVRLAALSVKNDQPAPKLKPIADAFFGERHPYRAFAEARAKTMREAKITPAPSTIHMVRQSGAWKLDWRAYDRDMNVISQKLKNVSQ